MSLLICILFISISIIVFLPDTFFSSISLGRYKLKPELFYFVFGMLLIVIASFRGPGVDRDYSHYVTRFNLYSESWSLSIEPTFTLISKFIKDFLNSNVKYLFLIYAFFGVSTKLFAIKQLSEYWALSLLIYCSYLFTLQDLTQIRAGVGAGFIMLCIKPLYDRNYLMFFSLAIVASLFHYSSLVILLFWFLSPKKINKSLYYFLILIAYLIHYLSIVDSELFKNAMFISPLLNKFLAYQSQNSGTINIFNIWQLLRVVLGIIFIWKIELITQNNKFGIILTKIYIISTCAYVVFAFNPVFASRISDILTVADIVLVPCILYIVKPNVFAKLIVMSIAFSYLFLNLFFNKIIL